MPGITHWSHIAYAFGTREQAEAFAADALASGLREEEPTMTVEVEELEPGTFTADITFTGDSYDEEGLRMSLDEIENTFLEKIARRYHGEWFGH